LTLFPFIPGVLDKLEQREFLPSALQDFRQPLFIHFKPGVHARFPIQASMRAALRQNIISAALRAYKVVRGLSRQVHPNQKPLLAIQPLAEAYSAPGAVPFGPFAGSGTTAVAVRAAGCQSVLVEIVAQHCWAARLRLAPSFPQVSQASPLLA
jgi:DNA modification methylase